MNDFTKEELESIRYAVDNSYFQANEFLDKIQSLIDNYSEHESTYDSSACAQVCRDCEKIL